MDLRAHERRVLLSNCPSFVHDFKKLVVVFYFVDLSKYDMDWFSHVLQIFEHLQVLPCNSDVAGNTQQNHVDAHSVAQVLGQHLVPLLFKLCWSISPAVAWGVNHKALPLFQVVAVPA